MATVILNASTGKARAVDGGVFADRGNGEIRICAYLRIRGEINKIDIARLTPDEADGLVADLLGKLSDVSWAGGE